jgi:hypothetical protein
MTDVLLTSALSVRYLRDIANGGAMNLTKFLVRLRPETRALLDRAAEDQRRSRASIIDEAVVEFLRARYSSTSARLNAMLGKPR